MVARRPLSVPVEAELWARRVFSRKAICRRFPVLAFRYRRQVKVLYYPRLRSVAADANIFHNRVRVGARTITPHLLVHELAHLLTPSGVASHGREFRRVYLTLVRYALGAESARALRAAFTAKGLTYRPYHARPALAGRRPPLAPSVAASLDLAHAGPITPFLTEHDHGTRT